MKTSQPPKSHSAFCSHVCSASPSNLVDWMRYRESLQIWSVGQKIFSEFIGEGGGEEGKWRRQAPAIPSSPRDLHTERSCLRLGSSAGCLLPSLRLWCSLLFSWQSFLMPKAFFSTMFFPTPCTSHVTPRYGIRTFIYVLFISPPAHKHGHTHTHTSLPNCYMWNWCLNSFMCGPIFDLLGSSLLQQWSDPDISSRPQEFWLHSPHLVSTASKPAEHWVPGETSHKY